MSHKTRNHDRARAPPVKVTPTSGATRADATVSPPPFSYRSGGSKAARARDRLSSSSSASGGRYSTDSNDDALGKATAKRRLSGLPRPTITTSTARLDAIAASSRRYPVATPASKSKTEVTKQSHEAKGDRDITQSNLRNKIAFMEERSNASRQPQSIPIQQTRGLHSSGEIVIALEPGSFLGTPMFENWGYKTPPSSMAADYSYGATGELPAQLIPELQALAASSNFHHPPLSSVSSPSSQYTTSPGPWSSRNTTPTTLSSYSPGITLPYKATVPGNRANTVPLPSLPKANFPKLPILPESLPSSSHGSNNRSLLSSEPSTPKKKKKRTPLNSPAPTPPPRKSSAKLTPPEAQRGIGINPHMRTESESQISQQGVENSPLAKRSSQRIDRIGDNFPEIAPMGSGGATSTSTQESPARPNRRGTLQFNPRRLEPVEGRLLTSKSRSAKSKPAAEGQSTISSQKSKSPAINSRPSDGPGKGEFNHSPHSNTKSNLSQRQLRTEQSEPGSVPYVGPDARTTNKPLKDAMSSSTSRLGKFSALSIFGRLTKSSATLSAEKPEKSSRKILRRGPAAGTGHEGYGKQAGRGRKLSLSSLGGSNRSNSSPENVQGSTAKRKASEDSQKERSTRRSQSELEDFVAQRLQPVTMLGGSKRPESDAHTVWPHFGERSQASEPNLGYDVQVTGGGTQTTRNDPAGAFHTTHLASSPYQRANKNLSNKPPPLAQRRSQRFGAEDEQSRLPTPIRTESLAPATFLEDQGGQISIPQTDDSVRSTDDPIYRVDPSLFKKQDRKGRKLRWNPFHRRQDSRGLDRPVPTMSRPAPELPVLVSARSMPRSIPYYAMIEPESENSTAEQLVRLPSGTVEPSTSFHDGDLESRTREEIILTGKHGNSILLPSLPIYQSENVLKQGPTPEPDIQHAPSEDLSQIPPEKAPSRPRRLAQVGRIPRVISRSERRHTPNAHSFSRPFHRDDFETGLADSKNAERPVLEIHTDVLPSRPFYEYDSAKPASAPARTMDPIQHLPEHPQREFFTLHSRHGSEMTNSTTSDRYNSVVGPALLSANRVLRMSRGPNREDEIWNEYDDFIDHVMSPSLTRNSDLPVTLSNQVYQPWSASGELHSTTRLAAPRRAISTSIPGSPTLKTPSAAFSPSLLAPPSSEDIRLRRSRIISALHSSSDPNSPFSIENLISEYGLPRRDSAITERFSGSTATDTGHLSPVTQSNLELSVSQNGPLPDQTVSTISRKDNSSATQFDLHFASLVISRWLSFGRVLFSPAHTDLQTVPDQHVLIIDGLHNHDFSFHCSLTYPTTFVHELKEVGQASHRKRSLTKGSEEAPPNHRSAEVSSLADRFPFPPSFFAAVVLRFLPSTSDGILKAMTTECKRVLKPGGYLECMLLDLDLVNMGNETRRAVREHKTRMSNADRDLSLRPISDNIQGMLGQRGFLNLNRCVVSVPVAGKVPGSTDSSSSSRSSKGSYGLHKSLSTESKSSTRKAQTGNDQQGHKRNFSLSDLISDPSSSSDAQITRTVSRIARWWWDNCYNYVGAVASQQSQSIFADKKVLSECKMRASGCKLLIAYAQKPAEGRRRTMSEPSLPVLATTTGRARRAVV